MLPFANLVNIILYICQKLAHKWETFVEPHTFTKLCLRSKFCRQWVGKMGKIASVGEHKN
jgi:hypothetical protein